MIDVIFIIEWEPHRISFRAYLENRTGDRTLIEEWSIKIKEAGDGALEVIVKEISQH